MSIFIVEDDKNIINFLKASLRAENFIIDAAEDGEKGAFWAKTNEY